MLFLIFLGTILGILFAIFIGIIPGLHINSVSYILTTLPISKEIIAGALIISAIVSSFLSFIPSTIFGVPDTDNFVATLPAQRLMLNGRGYYAIYLATIGAINGLIFGLPLFILFVILLPFLESTINILTPIILTTGLIILFFTAKNKFGFFVILFAGSVGFFATNFAFVKEPLLVIVSGLFGLSNIFVALQNENKIPKQYFAIDKINLFDKIKIGVVAPCLAIFVSIFPGIGNGFASYIGTKFSQLKEEGYILMNGAINVLVILLSFFVIFYLGRGRTASSIFFEEFAKNTSLFSLTNIILLSAIGIVVGYFLTLWLAKKILTIAERLNIKVMNYFLILFLHFLVLIFSNFLGLIVFWVSGLTGYICIKTNNPRMLMIACIIIPVLIYFI